MTDKNSTYNIVASMNGATVASEYEPEVKTDQAYQSEAELEASFIKQLIRQGYEYLEIHQEADLIDNLRDKLEKLNDYKFSDSEWKSFFGSVLTFEDHCFHCRLIKSFEYFLLRASAATACVGSSSIRTSAHAGPDRALISWITSSIRTCKRTEHFQTVRIMKRIRNELADVLRTVPPDRSVIKPDLLD